MAADDHALDALVPEPDADSIAEDAEPGAKPDHDADEAPDEAEPTVRGEIAQARDNLGDMLYAIDNGTTEDVDMDALLARARIALSNVDASPVCPMCAGEGVLAETPPADPRAERCQDCKGRGTVYTGSLVPESAVRPCGTCGGKGFNDKATVTPIAPQSIDYTRPPTTAQWYDSNDPATWHLPLAPGVPAPSHG